MGKSNYTPNYLLNQINWLRKWSLNLAGFYLAISLFLDYVRFPVDALSQVYISRFVFMALPIITVILLFYYQRRLNLSKNLIEKISFLGIMLIGIGHAEILLIAEEFEVYFPRTGITIILIYVGLLLALPIRYAILGSIIIIGYTSYTYIVVGDETAYVISHIAFYCMFASCCIFTNFACIKILRSNLELMKNTNRKAITDELTGLFNRRYFYEEADKLIKQSKRDGKLFSLLLIDMDHFKDVNDLLGHKYGDKVLMEFSQKISENCRRPLDIAARLGGDEFVMIIYDSDMSHVKKICNQLLDVGSLISTKLAEKNSKIKFSISIGAIASKNEATYPIDLLLEAADKALYKIKTSGKNNYEFGDLSSFVKSDTPSDFLRPV